MKLEFGPAGTSMAIFGENASGKSSITDAIEWVVWDRIGHLWREDCREAALRNVQLGDSDDAVVNFEFTDHSLSGSKTLASNFASVVTNKGKGLASYLAKAKSERLILRAADLTDFVSKTKADKRKEVAEIVGYGAVVDFRNTIQSTLNSLRKEDAYATAKAIADDRKARLLLLAGRTVNNADALFESVDALVATVEPGIRIADAETCDTAILALKAQFHQKEMGAKKVAIDRLRSACEDLIGSLTNAIQAARAFGAAYERTVETKDQVQKLTLEDLLRRGKQVIESGLCEQATCPLCEAPVRCEDLSDRLDARIQQFEAVRAGFEEVRRLKTGYATALQEVAHRCTEVLKFPEHLDAEVQRLLPQFSAMISEHSRAVAERFGRYERITDLESVGIESTKLADVLGVQVTTAHSASQSLELSDREQQIVDVITRIGDLRSAFTEYEKNSRVKKAYEQQITSLSAVFERFVRIQSEALQRVLDVVSCDVGKYYKILHPEENVDCVRLRVIGEEGIEFEYSFHGTPTYPPMKYLSESHLNSLGIGLFLASVKLFNKRSEYFVLDDVITSFDISHRRRLARLLADEFAGWQVILLTHERLWFEIVKRELIPLGWLAAEVYADLENGCHLKQSAKDLRELIQIKQNQQLSVGNDVRTLLEQVLKELCEKLEVKVAFRFNEYNEQRMTHELLSALRSTLNRKCPSLKTHPVLGRLEASGLVANVGSHDRSEMIGNGDLAVALDDIDVLRNLFGCQQCGSLASVHQRVPGEDAIACRCGRHRIQWKE